MGQRRRQREEKESRRGGGVVLGRRMGGMRTWIGKDWGFSWVWTMSGSRESEGRTRVGLREAERGLG